MARVKRKRKRRQRMKNRLNKEYRKKIHRRKNNIVEF